MDAEQDNTDYGSRAWQFHKLQRVKLRDSLQSDKLLKESYSGVINEKRAEPRQMKNGASKFFLGILGSVDKSLSHRQDFNRKHRTEPHFETGY